MEQEKRKLLQPLVIAVIACAMYFAYGTGAAVALGSPLLWLYVIVLVLFGALIVQMLREWHTYTLAIEDSQLPPPPFDCDYLPADAVYDGPGVYIIRDMTITGWFKIGKSENMPRRIGELSYTKLPVAMDLRVVHYIPANDPEQLEAMLHKMFYRRRKRGEWFNLRPEDVEYIRSIC